VFSPVEGKKPSGPYDLTSARSTKKVIRPKRFMVNDGQPKAIRPKGFMVNHSPPKSDQPYYIYDDSMSVVIIYWKPDSYLKKNSSFICYHAVRNTMVMGNCLAVHISNKKIIAD
jgi:hypothetical protein